NVYAIEGRSAHGVVTVQKNKVARIVNDLQVLSAAQNLYASNPEDEQEIRTAFQHAAPRRTEKRVDNKTLVPAAAPRTFKVANEENVPPRGNIIIPPGTTPLTIDRPVPFLSRRHKPRFHYDGSAAGARRDPAWCEITDDFRTDIGKKRVRWRDLPNYVRAHPA